MQTNQKEKPTGTPQEVNTRTERCGLLILCLYHHEFINPKKRNDLKDFSLYQLHSQTREDSYRTLYIGLYKETKSSRRSHKTPVMVHKNNQV